MEIKDRILILSKSDNNSIFGLNVIDYNSFDSIIVSKDLDKPIRLYLKNVPKKCTRYEGIYDIGDISFITKTLYIRKYGSGKYIIYNTNLTYPKTVFELDYAGNLEIAISTSMEAVYWVSNLSGYIDSFDDLNHLMIDHYFNKNNNIFNKFIQITECTDSIDVTVSQVELRNYTYLVIFLITNDDKRCHICDRRYYVYGGYFKSVETPYTFENKLFKI